MGLVLGNLRFIRRASDDVQVVNDRGATQIEEVLAESAIAGAVGLTRFDGHLNLWGEKPRI